MSDPIQLLRRWLLDDDGRADGSDQILRADTKRCVREHDDIAARLAVEPGVWSARLFDPDSSHDTVRTVAADTTLRAMILDVAARFPGGFDDGDLVTAIHQRYGVSPQRNVIARSRGLLEPSGAIVRTGPRNRPDRKVDTVHYLHWSQNQ